MKIPKISKSFPDSKGNNVIVGDVLTQEGNSSRVAKVTGFLFTTEWVFVGFCMSDDGMIPQKTSIKIN